LKDRKEGRKRPSFFVRKSERGPRVLCCIFNSTTCISHQSCGIMFPSDKLRCIALGGPACRGLD